MLLTGASTGIGRELAAVLAGRGARLVVTARDDNRARVATLGRSKAHRIVFARWHSRARGAGTIRVRMNPTPLGKRLVHRHAHRVTLTLSVTYTPSAGRRRRINVGGVHLPAGIYADRRAVPAIPVPTGLVEGAVYRKARWRRSSL